MDDVTVAMSIIFYSLVETHTFRCTNTCHACMNNVYVCTHTGTGTHMETHTLSSSSNTVGYTPPLLAALDLQWAVSFQLLMPRGACFYSSAPGPPSAFNQQVSCGPVSNQQPSTGRLQAPWGPQLGGRREEEGAGEGEEGSWQERLRWNHAMLLGQRAV